MCCFVSLSAMSHSGEKKQEIRKKPEIDLNCEYPDPLIEYPPASTRGSAGEIHNDISPGAFFYLHAWKAASLP